LRITPTLRKQLKKPLGQVTTDGSLIDPQKTIVAVGDFAADQAIRSGHKPKIIVYDGKTQRRHVGISQTIKEYEATKVRVENPPGQLNPEVFEAFKKAYNHKDKTKIFVEGEEDLTALAAIKCAGKETQVLYGQPGQGLVVVEADEKTKKKVDKIIQEMQ